MKLIDLVGQKFGRLAVIERAEKNGKRTMWKCVCDCGELRVVWGDSLRRGSTKSCGCLDRELSLKRFTTHGKTGTPEYLVWKGMRQRCNNVNSTCYYKYGKRGIKICDRWSLFENFLSDMGMRPSEKYSIERINNDGNYCPENCRWETATKQARNQRKRHDNKSGRRGVVWYKPSNKWLAKIGVDYKSIHLGYFDKLKDAIVARELAEGRYWNAIY